MECEHSFSYAVVMEVAALFLAESATLNNGAIDSTCVPMTSYEIDQIPSGMTVLIVVVVHTPAGKDYDAKLYVVCKDPAGERRGTIESIWHWPDDGNKSSKYRCFIHSLSFEAAAEGEYTIGVYDDWEATAEVAPPIPVSFTLAAAGSSRQSR